jgi:hypothetical protein
MLSLHPPLHTTPAVRDIHLFRNAGYSIHNEPKREGKKSKHFYWHSPPTPNTEHFNNAPANNQ